MSEAKKAAHSKRRIIDVHHPGKSAPSASSKPVLVTNRPILKDPMMTSEDAVLPATTAPELDASRTASVQPLDTTKPSDVQPDSDQPAKPSKTITQLAEEVKARAEKAAAPEVEKVIAEADPPAPQTEKPKASEEPEKSSITAPDKITPGAQSAADEDSKSNEAAQQEAALVKLVETKEYFLPINAVEKRRTKRVVLLGVLVSLLLAVAWADIALDAGIIQVDGVKPVTHFFSTYIRI